MLPTKHTSSVRRSKNFIIIFFASRFDFKAIEKKSLHYLTATPFWDDVDIAHYSFENDSHKNLLQTACRNLLLKLLFLLTHIQTIRRRLSFWVLCWNSCIYDNEICCIASSFTWWKGCKLCCLNVLWIIEVEIIFCGNLTLYKILTISVAWKYFDLKNILQVFRFESYKLKILYGKFSSNFFYKKSFRIIWVQFLNFINLFNFYPTFFQITFINSTRNKKHST